MSKLILPKAFEAEPVKVVWKYRLEQAGRPQQVDIPAGALFLHADLLNDDGGWVPNIWELWYEIRDVEAALIPHVFQIFGTGDRAIPKCAQQMWTTIVNTSVSRWVWHLYEYPSGTRVED